MPVHIALLRAVNVGGRTIKMAELRDLFESMGFPNAKTLLASGNVVFTSDQTNFVALSRQIEAGIEQHLGFRSDIILRSPAQMRAVIADNPFDMDADLNPSRLLVTFYPDDLDKALIADVEALAAEHDGPEEVRIAEQEIYIYYPDGMGRSKLAELFARRKLNATGTARNWNTVTKLLALAEDLKSNDS